MKHLLQRGGNQRTQCFWSVLPMTNNAPDSTSFSEKAIIITITNNLDITVNHPTPFLLFASKEVIIYCKYFSWTAKQLQLPRVPHREQLNLFPLAGKRKMTKRWHIYSWLLNPLLLGRQRALLMSCLLLYYSVITQCNMCDEFHLRLMGLALSGQATKP